MKLLKISAILFIFIVVTDVHANIDSNLKNKKNYSTMPQAAQEKDADQIVDKKTYKEIGQMLIIGFGGFRKNENGENVWKPAISVIPASEIVEHIRRDNIGGVFLKNTLVYNKKNKCFEPQNIASPQQLMKLTNDIQCYALQSQHLPIIISVDDEGGLVSQLDMIKNQNYLTSATYVPSALGEAQEKADNLIKSKNNQKIQEAKYINTTINKKFLSESDQLKRFHINMDLAPVVDVNINPVNPIIGILGRSFSSNPHIVVQLAEKFINAMHHNGIAAVLKHFPGYGSALLGYHENRHHAIDITNTYQANEELLPYRKLVLHSNLADAVLVENLINGHMDKTQCKPGHTDEHSTWCSSTMSQIILTTFLRKKLNFKGLIISSSLIGHTNEYPLETILQKSINAGVDMFIVKNIQRDDTNLVINAIAKLIKEGKIKKSQIHRAYNRIIQFKKKHFKNYLSQINCKIDKYHVKS